MAPSTSSKLEKVAVRISPCCDLAGSEFVPVPPLIVSLPVAASSTLAMVRPVEVKMEEPPAVSVVVAVTRTFWPTRDWADASRS